MKWKIEYITNDAVNILIDDPAKSDVDKDPVGMGFPINLAERIVRLHNDALEDASKIWTRRMHETTGTPMD